MPRTVADGSEPGGEPRARGRARPLSGRVSRRSSSARSPGAGGAPDRVDEILRRAILAGSAQDEAQARAPSTVCAIETSYGAKFAIFWSLMWAVC
jgi:hypothetical protein